MTKERSLLRMILVNFWNSLKPRKIWGDFVGKDYHGTEYYEAPLSESSRSRPARWFLPKNRDDFDQDIPPEWEAWLRYRRNQPPTEEEIARNLEQRKATFSKVAELNKEYPKTEEEKHIVGETSKKFPVYEDMEGMPGGLIKGNHHKYK